MHILVLACQLTELVKVTTEIHEIYKERTASKVQSE